MTAEEFDLIRAAYKSAYPTFNIMPDKFSIKLWYRMLGDLDYKMCETALLELFATHTYAIKFKNGIIKFLDGVELRERGADEDTEI